MSAGRDAERDAGGASRGVRCGWPRWSCWRPWRWRSCCSPATAATRVTAEFSNAGQLVKGNEVRVAGTPVGTRRGHRRVPERHGRGHLHASTTTTRRCAQGTEAIIKPSSLSGIANRYIDLQLGPDDGARHRGRRPHRPRPHRDRGRARRGLRPVRQGHAQLAARLHRGPGRQRCAGAATSCAAGIHYLNPALSTGAAPVRGADARRPAARALPGRLVDARPHARRRGATTSPAWSSNLNATFGALGSQQDALAESIERLPPFLRRANTTFVNLRAALDDVDPLVDAAKPAAKRLGPFLDQARAVRRATPSRRSATCRARSAARARRTT